jgi:PadR family transcriptional regulator, regulatory protein PadR
MPLPMRPSRSQSNAARLLISNTGGLREDSFLCLQIELYIGYAAAMPEAAKLSHTSAMILQAISSGHIYGYTIMEVTGLPSGTVYPALRRMEGVRLIRSQWERGAIADAEDRPPRKYYRLTSSGETTLEASRRRYPLLAKLAPTEEVGDV